MEVQRKDTCSSRDQNNTIIQEVSPHSRLKRAVDGKLKSQLQWPYLADMEVMPIATRDRDLAVEEALEFLRSTSVKPSSIPPANPKGGEIYLYSPLDNPNKLGEFLSG